MIEIHRKYYGNMSVEQPSLSSDKVSLSENQVLTPQNLHFLRDRDPVVSETAGILKAGLKSLDDLGKKMTSQSLGLKLIKDLEANGVGTNEIESAASRRQAQRENKKGKIAKRNFCEEQRDQKHIEEQWKIR